MRSRPADLLVVDALAIVALFSVLFGWPAPIRLVLVIPLVLVWPGYALTSAVFVRRVAAMTERAAFTLGGSLALVVLGGFLLNLTPLGLQANTWAPVLASITLAASLVALVRRRKLDAEESPSAAVPAPDSTPWYGSFSPVQGVLLGLAALVIAGAIGVSRAGALGQPGPSFTQLWLVPASEKGPSAVRLGISNMEAGATTYTLQLKVDGTLAREWPSISLQPGDQWENTLILPKKLSQSKVEAVLFRADAPDSVYRYVDLQPGTPTATPEPTPQPTPVSTPQP